jgi:hypothetical protein
MTGNGMGMVNIPIKNIKKCLYKMVMTLFYQPDELGINMSRKQLG